jgi:ATP/maltotriose-dependent transcriptional regulator MalT
MRNQPFAAFAAIWGGVVRIEMLDPADACQYLERELAEPRSAGVPIQRQMLAFRLAQARLMLGQVVELPQDVPAGGLFRAILDAAQAYATGDWPAGRVASTAWLDLTRRRGNRVWEADALHQLARFAQVENDARGAEDLLLTALDMVRGRHRPHEARVCSDLALLYATQSRTDKARAALNQCRSSLPESENWRGLGGRLALAEAAVAVAERQLVPAQRHFERAIAVFRHHQLPWDEAQTLECWGEVLLRSGNVAKSSACFDLATDIYRRHRAGPAWLLRIAAIRDGAHKDNRPGAQRGRHTPFSLREIEVLRLVAAGRSNQEIANALALSVRTVERHLSQMYNKLGASGKAARAVAAAYASVSGLITPTEQHTAP